MNNELRHLLHPIGLRIFWIGIYIFLAAFTVTGFTYAATQVRKHTLPVGKVELSIPYSKYVAGESIEFSLKNNYNSSIFVLNNCPTEPLAVYYQENGKWVRKHLTASHDACSDEDRQVAVAAGKTVTGNFNAWQSMFAQPGKYRIVAFVEYYNSLPYQDIEIVAKVDTQTQITDDSASIYSPTTNNNSITNSASNQTIQKTPTVTKTPIYSDSENDR